MNIKTIVGASLALVLVALLTSISPTQAQSSEAPTGLAVSQPPGGAVTIEWNEVPGTTYYSIKWISVEDEGKPGISQRRDGTSVVTSPIEENITQGAMIQSSSSRGTSVKLPSDLSEGWWFVFVASVTSKVTSDYSEPVYFEVRSYDTPDNAMAARWWNKLNGEQMVAALYGDSATEEQMMSAKKMYADLDGETKAMVNAAAVELYGEGNHYSVGAWWETLDCRLMRVAAGDGNVADSSSAFCAHYPGSGAAKILDAESKMFVDTVGKALLGRYDIGVYPMNSAMAARWWNTLNGDQMVAALYGDEASEYQMMAAKRMYAGLEGETKRMVNEAAADLYYSGLQNGHGHYHSVGEWWETLDCRKMRVAAGDGNVADSSSAFCAHYPGSGAAKILDAESKMFVDMVGKALLGRYDIGVYPMDSAMAARWWNTLNGEQMVAALHGDGATEAEMTAAKKMYADLDGLTKGKVNAVAAELYGEGHHYSVGAWWETLNCELMRVAAGDGNVADPMSAFCAHYPGSGAAKILDADSKMFVDTVGKALLGRYDIGVYPMDSAMAARWWNTLNGEQMVAALYGDEATEEQMMAAKRMYADLEGETKRMVNEAASDLYYSGLQNGHGHYHSVGEWWETLDCRKMRVAAGDGNVADPMSAFCAHYPGSGAAKILDADSKMFVDMVGKALLGRYDIGVYPMDSAMAARWWNTLNGEQMVAALYGDSATEEQMMSAKMMYADLDGETKGKVNAVAAELYGEGNHYSVGAWWETLNCELMRVAAGDGNVADPSSAFCAHYPGSGAAKILDAESKMFVDMVGKALLGRYDIGVYPMQ